MRLFDLAGPMPPLSALEGGWSTAIAMISPYLWLFVTAFNFRFVQML